MGWRGEQRCNLKRPTGIKIWSKKTLATLRHYIILSYVQNTLTAEADTLSTMDCIDKLEKPGSRAH